MAKGPESISHKVGNLFHGVACPVCGDEAIRRKKRDSWMYLIPFSRNYYCKSCKTRFVQAFDATWTREQARPRRQTQMVLAVLVLILIFLWLYLSMK